MASETRPRAARSPLIAQALKFGAVGGIGVIVNLAVFTALTLTVLDSNRIHHGPLYATVIATVAAIAANWAGNHFWAFRTQRSGNQVRQTAEFVLVSLAGLLIPLGCVWLSHYVLGLDSKLDDVVSNNVVGLVLGTLFRFALYRWWVYSPKRAAKRTETAAADAVLVAEASQTLPIAPDTGLVRD